MATAGAKPVGCELVKVGILKLVDASCNFPEYTSIVVLSADILLVIDSNAFSLRIHSCHNGQLLVASGRLQARPNDAFVLYGNRNEVAVTLNNGQIDILSVISTGKTAAIRQVRTLLVTEEFEYCHGVRALRSNNKLVVSGGKEDWICWGLVSHLDGHLDKIHKICKSGGVSCGSASYLAISPDDSIVYISCWTGPYYSKNNGVYGYDVMTGSLKFTYHSRDLTFPKGISVDRRGFIYVCNWKPTCIHQLTKSMQSVTIHRKGMPPEPMAIYWEEQQQELYVTRMGSKEVWRLSPQWTDQQGDHKAQEVLGSVERLQSIMEDISTQMKCGNNEAHTQSLGSDRKAASLSEKDGDKSSVVPDNPITQDHFNHARLCNALTTVCADALREILLTQVPAPYTNIYQAILANQSSLTRRRQVRPGQWQNALLNQEQSQLVFPDPQGQNVGTVQQLDISLLYTLIRNVSKVPAPTTGWGNPPTDHPRETTLGASVERIRLYRNNISGHSVDGKINHQEFEDYWHRIHEVLCDIENIIGDHGYREELAKRRNQNITAIETHEKRKKIRYMKDPVIPVEVLKMDTKSLQMYKDALRNGKEKVYNIRVMVVGQYGVGKTTLTRRLLGKDVNLSERKSTEGIDVHTECCKVSLATGEWKTQEKNAEQYSRLQRLVKLLNEHVQKQTSVGDQEGQSDDNGHPQLNQSVSAEQKISQKVKPRSEPYVSTVVNMGSETSSEIEYSKKEKKDAVIEILQLVNENSSKLEKSMEEYAALAMWDFAGQYIFYTTHQTFLTSQAVYLLVIDLSQQITDLVNDECFLDTEGIKLCKVHDLVDIWLNSIHSCSPSRNAGIPPVILVGTHVDKIPKESRQRVIDEYFMYLRHMLKDKVTVLHLRDDIAIDNTYCDPALEELKRKIFQLASQQPHWGEEKPARWIPMEQAVMKLKASGVKVAPLSLLEEINRSGSVRIDGKEEMELFLRFHHEIGTIIYFSVEGLRDIIVLEPQWLIDALKSLITAEMFIRNNPAIIRKWYQFKEEGKLTHELIDALWTKDRHPEFHDNKDHILLIMEHLNIIVKPRVYREDGREIKVENYFLVPCMLSEAAPEEVISPKPQLNTKSSSVLCYAFVEKFLPCPIFHRLLGACIAHWPIAKKSNSENLIYCCCCTFNLDLSHRLTVFFREYVIFVRVTRFGTTDKTPATKLCIDVREFITATLSKLIGYLGKSLQFELFIQCPKSDGYSVDSLIPVEDFQGNVDVPCHSHEHSHVIISFDVLKFWFHEKVDSVHEMSPETSDLTSSEEYQKSLQIIALPPVRYRNLGVQEETRVSPKAQVLNMKADIDQTETVFVLHQLVHQAKSVGIIRSPFGTSGTGFRVGPNYIMTAKHVVDQILEEAPVPLQQLHSHHPLSNTSVYIDFSYERYSQPNDENLRFHFEPVIVYANGDLDTVILKLKPDAKQYPPPLTNFAPSLPQGQNQGYFIGHPRASIKKIDKYHVVKLTPHDVIAAKKWSTKLVNVDGFVGIDNPHHVLLHCSFEAGASGAPGFWICPSDGQAYVELMLLNGYPSWYYDEKYKEKVHIISHNYLIVQGVSMKAIYDDMIKQDEFLCKAIFTSND